MEMFAELLKRYQALTASARNKDEQTAYWNVSYILQRNRPIRSYVQSITELLHETEDRMHAAIQEGDATEAAQYAAIFPLYERAWREIMVAHVLFLGEYTVN